MNTQRDGGQRAEHDAEQDAYDQSADHAADAPRQQTNQDPEHSEHGGQGGHAHGQRPAVGRDVAGDLVTQQRPGSIGYLDREHQRDDDPDQQSGQERPADGAAASPKRNQDEDERDEER